MIQISKFNISPQLLDLIRSIPEGTTNARMVKLVDTLDLKSSDSNVRAGSSPALSTKDFISLKLMEFFYL